MSTAPLVSIIINNYNYGRFLNEAISSALIQNYPQKEIIVVDDGSTDNSREIINEYGTRITTLFKSNGGQASAFNEGFFKSKGHIIIFLDADDIINPGAVQVIAGYFNQVGIAKIHWQLETINYNGESTGKILPEKDLAEGNLKEVVIKQGPVACGAPPYSPPTSGNAWSRSYLEEIFPMPEKEFRQTADFYLMALAPVFGSIKSIPTPLGKYRLHGKNSTLTKDYLKNYLERFEYVCLGLSKYLKQKGIITDQKQWPRTHWFHVVQKTLNEIDQNLPENSAFILVDGMDLGVGREFHRRICHHFIEREGLYYGSPVNDEEGIKEIKTLINAGAAFLVIAWTCFWMLEHYKDLTKYLTTNFKCTFKNDRLVIYSLKEKGWN